MNESQKLKTLEAIEKNRIEQIAKAELEYEVTKKTGLKCSAISSKWVVFRKVESEEDVRHILKIYKPTNKENAYLKFAGKQSIETESPFLLCISNYKHVKDDKYIKASLKYKTDDGLEIWIDLDKRTIDIKESQKQVNPSTRAKYPEMYSFFVLSAKYGLKCQEYQGGHLTYYGSSEKFLAMFN